jgi:hypothetical protein
MSIYYEEKFNLDRFLDEELGKVPLTKKGQVRKRKPKEPRIYFTQDTEDAIIEYLATEDTLTRNKIYNERIRYAFYKLSENIIHTFKFYYTDSDTIEELKHEVVTFLLEKLHLYAQDKGKAYSYFGTIAKRYLIIYNQKNYEKLKEKADVNEIDDDPVILNDIVKEATDETNPSDFMSLYVQYIDKHIYNLFPKNQDLKTADAIMELFRKRESIEMFNKKALYIYIREITDATTPQITKVTKKLKLLYVKLYNEYYKYGCIKS